ncbi:hypothetical protein Hanom_Chr04g00306251 [Helianthus anomalus]
MGFFEHQQGFFDEMLNSCSVFFDEMLDSCSVFLLMGFFEHQWVSLNTNKWEKWCLL